MSHKSARGKLTWSWTRRTILAMLASPAGHGTEAKGQQQFYTSLGKAWELKYLLGWACHIYRTFKAKNKVRWWSGHFLVQENWSFTKLFQTLPLNLTTYVRKKFYISQNPFGCIRKITAYFSIKQKHVNVFNVSLFYECLAC